MGAAITAYLDTLAGTAQDPDPVLYVERDERGPLVAITPRGGVAERFRLPDSAVELITPDEAVALVLELIADVPMARGVRKAIAERLDVDADEVGTAPPRRKGAA